MGFMFLYLTPFFFGNSGGAHLKEQGLVSPIYAGPGPLEPQDGIAYPHTVVVGRRTIRKSIW